MTSWATEDGPRALLRQIHDGADPEWIVQGHTHVLPPGPGLGRAWRVGGYRTLGTDVLLDLAALADAGFEVTVSSDRAGDKPRQLKVLIAERSFETAGAA